MHISGVQEMCQKYRHFLGLCIKTDLHYSFIISKGLQSTTPIYIIPSSYPRACRALHRFTLFLHHIKGLAEHYTDLHYSFIISKGLQSTTPIYIIPSSYQRACRALHRFTLFLHHIKGLAEHYTDLHYSFII